MKLTEKSKSPLTSKEKLLRKLKALPPKVRLELLRNAKQTMLMSLPLEQKKPELM